MEREAEQAKWEGYRKGRLERARAEGRRAGKQTRMDRVGGALAGFERSVAASNRAADVLMGGLGGSGDLFGFGEPPRRRRKKR